jgi:lysine-specific permease
MIAIGSTIGTGLFLTSGTTISMSGPGGALLGYLIIGLVIYFLINNLGELSTFNPTSGSVISFAKKYINESIGFSVGWMYFYKWAGVIAIEIMSSGIIMRYWFPHIPLWIFALIFFLIIFILNLFGSKVFGEVEFWMSTIKVVTITLFLIIGIFIITGVIGANPLDFSNFFYKDAPFVGGLSSFLSSLVFVALCFGGSELIGIAAGESKNPSKSIPKAVRSVILRILIFYIGTIIIIGIIIPYTSPYLLNTSNSVAISPFVLIFHHAALPYISSIMNFVILTAVISSANAAFYGLSRVLFSLGEENFAPKKLTKSNKKGIPYFSLIVSAIVGIICIIISTTGHYAYIILIQGASASYFLLWALISLSHYRFRKGFIKQGYNEDKLPFKAKFYPYSSLIVVIACLFLLIYYLINGISTDFYSTLYSFIPIMIFVVLFICHKLYYKTKLIPLDEIEY